MRIVISLLNFRPGKIGGTETYLRQVMANMYEAADGDDIAIVVYRDIADAIEAEGIETIVVDRAVGGIIRSRCFEAFTPYRDKALERVFESFEPDVVFFPQQSLFPKALRVPTVLTVHGLQHVLFRREMSLFDLAFRRIVYSYSLKHVGHIIAISQFDRNTLVTHCGVPPEKITVVPHGSPDFDPDTEAATPCNPAGGRFLFYPAATWPQKNHEVLFETFAQLKARGKFDYKLVLAGVLTPRWKKLQRLIRRLKLQDAVIQLGSIPFEKVCRIYRAADAVVFPTLMEDFGLPVIEATKFRKKLITSRLEIFDEIGVPKQWQIDFADPEQLLRALEQPGPTVLEKVPLSWAQTTRKTVEVLRQTAARMATTPEAT